MPLTWLTLAQLTLEDERSFRHVALYQDLKAALAASGARFAVIAGSGREDHAMLLNLAFWQPSGVAEVLADERLTADQLLHNAWHQLALTHLGDAAASAEGMLLAESIASAFDLYLVGRLLGHAPESQFLTTQVPAMADATYEAGMSEEDFEALLERASAEPERCFEALRQLLFTTANRLRVCADVGAAAAVLEQADQHELGPLLHHFALQNWVLFARAHARPEADGEPARAVDRALRESPCSLDWLAERWVSAPARG